MHLESGGKIPADDGEIQPEGRRADPSDDFVVGKIVRYRRRRG
jgi:hypothetical protein